jgi:hypothetical protein
MSVSIAIPMLLARIPMPSFIIGVVFVVLSLSEVCRGMSMLGIFPLTR